MRLLFESAMKMFPALSTNTLLEVQCGASGWAAVTAVATASIPGYTFTDSRSGQRVFHNRIGWAGQGEEDVTGTVSGNAPGAGKISIAGQVLNNSRRAIHLSNEAIRQISDENIS